MEDSAGQSGGTVEEPPPPPPPPLQDQSASESLLDSTVDSGPSVGRRPPPPPSPLTGCYLLIVIGEPHSERHKEIILQKISKGFLSWDVNECHVSLEKELQSITVQSPEGEEARYGERLIQYATENLVTEILIHPQLNTLHQCMKNLLSSFTKHRHIIHAGYTFAGNGSWILQDGTLSISDLVEALHEAEVLRVLKAYENSVTIDVHCAAEGDWTTERFQKEPVSKLCKIRVNPDDVMTAGDPAISAFMEYLSPFLEPTNIQQLLQPTDVVGNIRFTHPTLYVFPGGQGDAALFGINGFNMLVDGGFSRKACFWDFARHLDRLDAVLLTRLNNSTVNGISAVLQRKKMNHVYPQIGHFFCNLQDRKIALSPDGDKDKDSLIVNLAEEGQEIVANLKHLALKPHPCYRDGNQVDPVNLYHKVGHGKLDMYVISPARDSQAVKDFLAKWSANDNQLFSNTGKKVGSKGFDFPIQNLVSICALLVWQPANPNDTITRILFPGSTPQHKIFEGLDKLRHLEFLKHPVCSARSISPSASAITMSRSLSRTRQPDDKLKSKTAENVQKPSFDQKARPKPTKQVKPSKPKSDTNKLTEEKTDKVGEESKLDGIKKIGDKIYDKDEKIESITKEIQKIRQESAIQRIEADLKKMDQNEEDVEKQTKKIVHRSKYDMRNVKSKVDSRAPSKSMDRRKTVEKKAENGGSPPITPKKSAMNGTATRSEKSRSLSRTSRGSPSATPGKSVKEANNRKVVEARVISRTAKAPLKTAVKKEETPPPSAATPSVPPTLSASAKTERKPISRRPKAISPAKKAGASPVRAAKAAKPSVDSVAKKIVRKLPADLDKTGTDSTVSTPSAEVEATIAKKEAKDIASEPEPAQVAQEAKTDLGDMTEDEENKQVDMNNLTENKETDEEAVKDSESEEGKSPRETATNIEIQMKEETRIEGGEEEEEDYLIITKEEPMKIDETEKDDSLQEDAKTKDETEGEGEIKKIHRDEEDSEKKRKMMEAEVEGPEREKEEVDTAIEGRKEEGSEESPRLSDRKDTKEWDGQQDEGIDMKEPVSKEQKEGESQPDEKFSTTVETSATTAPTLPEDEKIEEPEKVEKEEEEVEAKEEEAEKVAGDEIVEEKYTKEDIKDDVQEEKVTRPDQPSSLVKNVTPAIPPESEPPQPRVHPRDLVKTPDEVADLPVHEEVDPGMYGSGEFNKDLQKVQEKEVDEEQVKVDFKASDKGEAIILDEKEAEEEEKDESEMKKLEEDMNETEKVKLEETEEKAEEALTHKYLDIIDQLEKSSGQEKSVEGLEETHEKSGVSSGKSSPSKRVEEIAQVPEKTSPFMVPEESSAILAEVKGDIALATTEEEREGHEEFLPHEKSPTGTTDQTEPVNVEEVIGKLAAEQVSEAVSSGKSSPAPGGKEASAESFPGSDPSEEDHQPKESAKPAMEMPPEEKFHVGGVIETSQKLIESEKKWYEEERTAGAESKEEPTSEEPKIESKESGKSTPVAETVEISGKSTPVGDKVDNEIPEECVKVTPAPSDAELSGKAMPEISLSGKATPAPSDAETSKKITPAHFDEEASEKITPHQIEKDGPGKVVLPISEGKSGKVTPALSDKGETGGKVSPTISEKDDSGKDIPVVAEDESGKVTPALSDKGETGGKVSPTISEKDDSGKDIPVVAEDESGKVTPALSDKGETGGEVSPTISEKDDSGKDIPVVAEDESGKVTPALSDKGETGGKVSPSISEKGESGKVSPALPEKGSSGKTTPDIAKENLSEKVGPGEEVGSGMASPAPKTRAEEDASVKSGKATPEPLGKSMPEDKASGGRTPEIRLLPEKEMPEKEPIELTELPEKSMSGRTTPEKDSSEKAATAQPDEDSSRKATPTSLDKEVSGKISPVQVEKETSGKITPVPSEKEGSGKVTPALSDKETSGKITPAISEIDFADKTTLEVSGKATPTPLENVPSGKITPVEEPSDKVTPSHSEKQSSGKTTPSQSEKDPSGKVTPETTSGIIASSLLDEGTPGKATPTLSDKEASGKVSPIGSEKEPSGQVTPAPSDKAGSGKVSPTSTEEPRDTASGKVTPSISRRESPTLSEKYEGHLSGKSSPLSEKEPTEVVGEQRKVEKSIEKEEVGVTSVTPIIREETPIQSEKDGTPEVSERETCPPSDKHSSDVVKSLPEKDVPVPEKAPSGISSPIRKVSDGATSGVPGKDLSDQCTTISSEKDVSDNITSMSGKDSPLSEKESLGKMTPNGAGMETVLMSGKATPSEREMETSGKATPEEDVSGKATPAGIADIKNDTSYPESPKFSEKGSPRTEKKSLVDRMSIHSGKSTPLEALKSSSVASSLPESPVPSSGIASPSGDRKQGIERTSASGKSTPMDFEDGSLENGLGGPEDELEKGILESERHEKESQLTNDISSGEEEELKALEQADDGDDSESEGAITREGLQSLAHGEMASRTPESASGSPKKKIGSSTSSTPGEHIIQESAQSSPKGKKDDINKLVKSGGETDNQAAVKRMLVTASSEDGGGETEICPHGSIRLSRTEIQTEEGEGEKREEEEFGSLISQARKEYNLQRSGKSSVNASEHSSEEEEEEKSEVVEGEGAKEEEFGSLILQAKKEYNLQRSRKSSRTSPEPDDDVPIKKETFSTTTISKTESSRIDENDMTIMITTILTEEREEQEDGSVKVTKRKEVITKGGKDEGSVVTVEEGREEAKKSTEITTEDESYRKETFPEGENTLLKDTSIRLEELRSSSMEMSPLKTTYITSDAGDAEELMTSSFYGRGDEEVLEYRREKGYESVTQIGPDGEMTEKTYFYTSDPEMGMSSGAFMKGIPEAIPEAPEMTFETFPTRDSFVPEDFAKAVDEHLSARGEHLGQGRTQTPKEKPEEKEKDLLEGWGKPLGLPLPPKNARNTAILTGQNISTTSSLSTPSDNSDSVTNWGHPMNLPSPVPPATQNGNADPKETPKKDKKPIQIKKTENKSSGNNTPNRRSESPVKQPERRALSAGRNKSSTNSFLYLDLTYVPHHGNSYYSNVEFFKRVRARYYVFSGTEPSKDVYNALLEAKQTWEDKDLEVTIIPTYDTDILGYWVAENEEILAKNKIDLSPSASRCTINLQDHETSCSAYRLEF